MLSPDFFFPRFLVFPPANHVKLFLSGYTYFSIKYSLWRMGYDVGFFAGLVDLGLAIDCMFVSPVFT